MELNLDTWKRNIYRCSTIDEENFSSALRNVICFYRIKKELSATSNNIQYSSRFKHQAISSRLLDN